MAEYLSWKGAKLAWHGAELAAAARQVLVNRLYLAGELLKTAVQKNLSVSTRSSGPSRPGEFPHADTGMLRNSIFYNVDEASLTLTVGTPLQYGLYLEYGTAGGKILTAAP